MCCNVAPATFVRMLCLTALSSSSCSAPAAGFFKGKREKLSAAFVDRFVAVAFKPLPQAEWEQVVAVLLQQGGLPDQQADELSKLLVGFHVCVQAAIEGTDGSTTAFPEVGVNFK